jgi:double zinc ribbon protein/phospholipase D-like protein
MTSTNGSAGPTTSVIPRWAVAVALVLLFNIAGAIIWFLGGYGPDAPPIGIQFLLGLFAGSIAAFMLLAVIYVNRDARRRGMNATLWTLLVIFVPNAIGFILYFVLRPPLVSHCPACGAVVRAEAKYCTACGRSLRPGCPACSQPIAAGDAYCASCGRALAVPGDTR